MLRRIATVALVVGSAAALLIGSSTYAPFNDQATATGNVGSGFVEVTINGEDAHQLAFSTDECSNMAPEHDCVVPLTVSGGDSTLSTTWQVTVADTDDAALDCFTETVEGIPSGDAEDDDADVDHDPAGEGEPPHEHNGTLTVAVTDSNDCQNATSTVTLTVIATQSDSPYN